MRNLLILLVIVFSTGIAHAQAIYTAATCNRPDVDACINGSASTCNLSGGGTGAHTAVDGDTIKIPSGACTWASVISVPTGIGVVVIGNGTQNSSPLLLGAGTVGTTITAGGFVMSPLFGNSTSRISTINFLPGTVSPITVNGSCAVGGCPNLRLDNLFFPTGWIAAGLPDSSVAFISNVFGVADHNTIGDISPGGSYINFINQGYGSWQGIGSWGDNSWASADTFGTNQAFFLENDLFVYGVGTDTDIPGGNGGGARIVCRFNSWNPEKGDIGACSGHGTDTTGRARGVRQWEFYWNTILCDNTAQGCGSAAPGRSGVGRSFANTATNVPSNAFFKGIANFNTQRRWRPDSPWGACDGSGAWDTNDGVNYFPGSGTSTMTSVVSIGNPVITDIGTPGWTVNQWFVNGNPYSMHDTVSNGGFLIGANSSNTLTGDQNISGSAGAYAPVNGHTYQILRATACIDQGNRSGGVLLSGTSPTPTGPVNQTIDPTYEADDALGSHADHTVSSNDKGMIPNRDLYVETVNQAANSGCPGACTPFTGATGTGHGTIAQRPPTCTTGVGYWATDQGSWNTFDNTKEGVLYICGVSGWPGTPSYTPYTYPHPLITSPPPTLQVAPAVIHAGIQVQNGVTVQ